MTESTVFDLRSALRFLDGHVNLEAAAGRIHGLSLEAMRGLVGVMGEPQVDVRTVHITGTNGKGSVSAMISGLLVSAGLRVGGDSSPHVDTVRASDGLLRLRRGGLARISGEMTPPSSSRGVGGADRVRRNCCRPRLAKQWKQRTAFARLRGVQQQRRSTGAGRGRSSSSSIGSMLEPRSRSRRGDRFMVYVQCDICAVRVDHGASGNLIYRLSGAPNAANASEASRADSCSRLRRSGGSLRAAAASGQGMPGNRESAEPWPYAAKASK